MTKHRRGLRYPGTDPTHAIIGDLDIEHLPRGQRSARVTELAARTYRLPDRRTEVPVPPAPS